MSEFTHVSIVKKANLYFDGKVASRTVIFPDGSKKTLGIMQPGEYRFDTQEKELMEILGGSMDVKLADGEWQRYESDSQFSVPANSYFDLVVHSVSDYCCSYISE